MKKRHLVLSLLLALAIVTYLDRIAIASAGPRIQEELAIPPDRWGWVLGAFVLAYGVFEAPAGAMGDKRGQRRVLTRIVVWWSAFTALTGAAVGFVQLTATRFLFGAGEAGAYPNIAGVLARWFPQRERARMQGFVWAASRFGGALSPLIVIPMQKTVGWRWTFFLLGVAGILWALIWRGWYHDSPAEQPGITAAELAEIPSSPPLGHGSVPWTRMLRHRQMQLLVAMYFTQAWGSYFYFGWFPTYLVKGAGFSETEMGLFTALPFFLGSAGNIVGGYLCDLLAARFGLRMGRRLVGTTGLMVSAILLAGMTVTRDHMAIVVLSALGFGFADLMLPAAWAICLDVGRSHAGAVTGVMNTAGQLGGFVCSVLFGYVVKATGSYQAPVQAVAFMVMVGALFFSRIDATQRIFPEEERAEPAGA